MKRKILQYCSWANVALDRLEIFCLSFAMSILTALIVINVVSRMFFQSLYFIEEVSEFLILFITFMGISYATRKARHIRMAAILDLVPDWIEKIMIFVISAISAAVMFIMSFYALNYLLEVKAMEQTTSALRLPYWTFLVIMPIGFFISGVQFVRTFIKNIVEKDVWLSCEQQSEYEELDSEGGQK